MERFRETMIKTLNEREAIEDAVASAKDVLILPRNLKWREQAKACFQAVSGVKERIGDNALIKTAR